MGAIAGRDDRFRERFQRLLLFAPTRDLPAGWQLAADLGRPVAPLLWDLLQAENSNVGRRLAVLAAVVLAGGPSEDERLVAWLDRQQGMLQERVLAAMLMALGPRRQRPVPGFWARCHGPDRSTEQILAIALRLAASRFPGSEAGIPAIDDGDPGVAAAAAFAGLPVPASLAARLWNLRAPERHAELLWRGALLGGARQIADGRECPEILRERARDLMTLGGDQYAGVRAAAALFRLRARDLRVEGARPDWNLLQVAVSESAGARALQAWLGPVPQPRDEEPQRLSVSYVLSRGVAEVVAERALWAGDARIHKHVAVALAWRLLGEEEPERLDVELRAVPEWNFVRWASGGAFDPAAEFDDAPLRVAAKLIVANRMPREALRATLEEALWRWESHPGLAMWQHERLLVRDLLLVGSNPGGGKYLPHVRPEQRYRPSGMGPDDVFFEVAVALYDFLARTRPPVPPDYHLR